MVEVGESTGALQEMLNSLSEFYDEEIDTSLTRFITIVEPALLALGALSMTAQPTNAAGAATVQVQGANAVHAAGVECCSMSQDHIHPSIYS